MARPGPKAHPEPQPRPEPFGLSTDPFAMETSHEVAAMYLAPPERVLVLRVDADTMLRPKLREELRERSGDPLPATVQALLASLDSTREKVLGTLHRRRRGVEFRRFLSQLERELPESGELHLICDNYFTHKSPTVVNWLRAHPRVTMHFAPSEEAWLAHVERWFAYQAAREAFHGDKSSAAALSQGIVEWMKAVAEVPASVDEGSDEGTEDEGTADAETATAHVWVKPQHD
ncbi:transposase [Kitasatospora sp. GAS204B]|uniref:transposase n=1 Tax=unclassified Kitasatospora TaxID=2633591 RepID=UPI002476EF49|nr:transposase [Kitasatospora sp. GAS204B]